MDSTTPKKVKNKTSDSEVKFNKKLQGFADKYTAGDFERIRLKGNGRRGKYFKDSNSDFRIKLCEHLVSQINTVNIELVRDLYVEETKWSGKSNKVYWNLYLYAQELLRRDWRSYLMDYLRGGTTSTLVFGEVQRIQLDLVTALEILDYFKARQVISTDKKEQSMIAFFHLPFKWIAEDAHRRNL